MKRTAATAPLSLANVKISSTWDASVALASHETKAIHGVVARLWNCVRMGDRQVGGVKARKQVFLRQSRLSRRVFYSLLSFVSLDSVKWTSAPWNRVRRSNRVGQG